MLKQRVMADVVILDLPRKKTTEDLKAMVTKLTQQGHKKLIINLSDVSFMDSKTFGTLIAVYKLFYYAGGQMVLYPRKQNMVKLFDLLKLNKIMKIYDTEQDAIAGLGQATDVPLAS